MSLRQQIRSIIAGAALVGLPALSFAALEDSAPVEFNIGSEQPLSQALTQFASQSGIQVIFMSKATDGLLAPTLQGRYTPSAALERLLSDSPLTYRQIRPDTVEIRAKEVAVAETSSTRAPAQKIRLAQADTSNDSSSDGLMEVMVTARHVTESLQSTPIAVSAFNADMLKMVSADNALDISGRAPNVNIAQTGGGASAASVFVRGIGNNALGFNLQSPVGTYVDDVFMPRLQGTLIDLLDLERIEILRGPQGTLYGRDSTVGALKYVSRNPDLYDAEHKAKIVLGDYQRRDILFGTSVPLIPGELALKIDVSSRSQDGYMYSVDANGKRDGRRGNGIDRQSGRVALLWTPNDRWSVNYIADISNDDSGSTHPTAIVSSLGGACNPAIAPCVPAFGSVWNTGMNIIDSGSVDSWGQNLRVEYDAGFMTIKSITAYRELEGLDMIDQTRLPGQGVLLSDLKDQNQFSQEFQFHSASEGPLSWVGGLVYFREEMEHDANFYGTHLNDDRQVAESYAVFANASYELFDGFRFELGGRWTYEDRYIDRAVLPVNGGAPLIEGRGAFDEDKATYKVGFDYQITPDMMIYFTHSTGYRPGSFSSTYASPVVPQIVFGHTGAETAVNNEIGIKSDWFDRRLRANIAIFDTDYENLQTQSTAIPYNVTATDFEFRGVELELEARPISALSLFASIGYLDADTLSGVNKGKRPRRTPEWTYSIGGEYRWTIGGTELFVNANNVYSSEQSTDPSNVSSVMQGSYNLLGANVGAEFQDGKYRVSFGGKNLLNEKYFLSTALNRAQYYAPPRMLALELEVKL